MSEGMNNTGCPEGDIECLKNFITETRDLYATDCFGLASFVILVYDHLLTFDDEVEFVWKAKWSKKPVSHPAGIYRKFGRIFRPGVQLYSEFMPDTYPRKWNRFLRSSRKICNHFVRYEGAMTMIGISIAAIIMGLRVSALYHGNYYVKILLASTFLCFVGVNSWLLTSGIAVSHPFIHGCTMIFGPQVGSWASASAWIPLVYDTIVVCLVLLRATPLAKASVIGQDILVKRLLRDGLVYYGTITAASLVLTIMIETASPGIKNICGQFQLLITVTMISRVTINLRKHLHESNALRLPTVQGRVSTISTAKNNAILMSPISIPITASPQAVYFLDIRRQRADV